MGKRKKRPIVHAIQRSPTKNPGQTQPSTSQLVATQTTWSGPLPPPAVLQKFEDTLPGAAERVFVMTEENNTHLNQLDRIVLEGRQKKEQRGQFYGFMIALFALSLSGALGFSGHEITASVIGGSTLLGLVSIFVTGRFLAIKSKAQE